MDVSAQVKTVSINGVSVEWHLLSPLGMATSLDFRASRLACSRQ